MRTNEEFRAEVYRRAEEEKKRRRERARHTINALICLPLGTVVAFLGISLAIAMQPAGSAAPDRNTSVNIPSTGAGIRDFDIPRDDTRMEALLAFFKRIEKRAPEAYLPDADAYTKSYRVSIGHATYFVCESYVRANDMYYSITENEFSEFLSIMGE